MITNIIDIIDSINMITTSMYCYGYYCDYHYH